MNQVSPIATFRCVETEQSKKENAANVQIQLEFLTPQKMKVSSLADGDIKPLETVAVLDEHDSYKDLDNQGYNFYNLDEKYDRNTEDRFVTSNSTLAASDFDSILFVEKTILAGKAGKLSLSGGQANNGDSGDAILWGRTGEFDCIPQ